jgi:hypothetical protein
MSRENQRYDTLYEGQRGRGDSFGVSYGCGTEYGGESGYDDCGGCAAHGAR